MPLDPALLGVIVSVVLVFFFALVFVATRYKRCPSNKVLVIFGKVGKDRSARCIHGGAAFVVPLIQDYAYLDLSPRTIEIDLIGALSKKNIRVNVPSTFTVGVSTKPEITHNAAERLLGLNEVQIREQAKDIILGQMRLVIATLAIEEINQDREKFLDLVNTNVGMELQKIGLEVINVNIRDITDESGYIDAIGKRAAADAINQARIEVAQADMTGAVGESEAVRKKQVRVAEEVAQSVQGQKGVERNQSIAVAKYEAEAVEGRKQAERDQQVAVARLEAESAQGQKEAEASRRVAIAKFEAEAVAGENASKARMAAVNAELAEKEAIARRAAEVARAQAERDILAAQKERELARLAKDEVAQKEINKQKLEIDADAHAEQTRRVARGDADAILAKLSAEAEGQRKILEAKAEGYKRLIDACGGKSELVPTLLMIEKLEAVVAEQVKAIQHLKIDKITVWDSGAGTDGKNTTANFLSGMIGALPPMHELARQAGVKLPDYLGRVGATDGSLPAASANGAA
ncbi:MAG TPA: SPFH domain-containing protein, partial [Planctomycetota bacterium]|nr:SPFH domain-containing protein [Planctomycetota bacterium]